MTFNTGNPVGSTDARDLYDNAQNFDKLSVGPEHSYPDRLGVPRKSWAGMEADFSEFLAASGFEPEVLEYVDGSPLTVDRPTQLIERAATPGILYAIKLPATFPAGLSGNWAADEALLVIRVDDSLRQELAQDDGAAKVGYKSSLPFSVSQSVKGVFDHLAVTPYTFGAVGNGVADDTAAVVRAFEAGYSFFDGVFKCAPFEVTGKQLDIHFAPGAKLVFDHQGSNSATFTNCSGQISGIEIDDSAETVTGVYVTFLLNACSDLTVNRPILNGGKDLPVAVYQSDNCHIIDGVGKGSDANRPFGWELISCKGSTFTRCRLYKYQFGLMLIGPGYKSGTILPSTRTWADTLGMKAVDCYVEDHTGHAFDMNGVVGGAFSGCTAKDYTGTVGNSSFQVKQSTNIAEELPDASYFNSIENCTAVDCVTGFSTQQGTDVQFRGLRVIRAKRYPVTFNSTKRVVLDGLMVTDWGLDLVSWPLLNGDAVCAGLAIWNGSDSCEVRNVILTLTDSANPNIGTLALCNVVGNNCTVGAFRYYREVGVTGTLSRAIRISGSNTLIEAGFRPGGASFYANHPVDDATDSTMYPLEFGMNVSLTVAGAFVIPNVPQRGMIPVKIFAMATIAPSGSPTYSVGYHGNNAGLLASRAAPSSIEVLSTTVTSVTTGLPLKVAVGAGTGGQLSVSVRGLHLL